MADHVVKDAGEGLNFCDFSGLFETFVWLVRFGLSLKKYGEIQKRREHVALLSEHLQIACFE